ncbi:hypothetical protein [Sphingomonas sp. MMS24-J13]|uniref:hypothetical protein n=1 Tax=Sphingomonas sp. MMS24-J13 TaxID=3238686 RepID=UPI00384E1301
MSGLDSFDPQAFIRTKAPAPAERTDDASLPMDWRRGLARLAEMAAPDGWTRDAWPIVQGDAERFAISWAHEAIRLGWSIGSLFGFDPDQPYGFTGLVVALRGDRVVDMFKDDLGRDVAAIKKVTGGYRWHYRHMPDEAAPIWSLRGAR